MQGVHLCQIKTDTFIPLSPVPTLLNVLLFLSEALVFHLQQLLFAPRVTQT